MIDLPLHRPIERKVCLTIIDEDGDVDYVTDYAVVCVTCVEKYAPYQPWPCPFVHPEGAQ